MMEKRFGELHIVRSHIMLDRTLLLFAERPLQYCRILQKFKV